MSDEWKDEEDKNPYGFSSMWLGLTKPETPEEKAIRLVREGQKVKWSYGHYREAPAMDAPVFERVGFQPFLGLECRRCHYGSNAQHGGFIWVMSPKS